MAELKQVRNKKHRDGNGPPLLRGVAYERLKNAIQDGEFQPGEPLSETRLSQALQISRTPVREALQQLAQEGLVQIMPNRAVTVASPSMQEVLNVLHVRSLLEPEIVRLVAETVTDETIKVLRKSVADMDSAVQKADRSAWARADNVYHETLSDVCPNTLLGQLGLQMRNRIQFLATDMQTTPARLLACTEEHRAIVQAIADRNVQAAQEATLAHIHELRASFFKRLVYT
jgi:DNA-binding GntR family transcriptional regulator